MEAMAMECIPISTRVSGIPELITDSENGFLVNPRNVRALKYVLRDVLLGNAKTNVSQSDIRKQVIKNFNVRTCSRDLHDTILISRKLSRKHEY